MFSWLKRKTNTRLALLKYTSEQFSEVRLDDVTLIACQHLLGTTLDMLEVLYAHGLKPENTYILGKCYSTNGSVYRELQRRGIQVSPLSARYDSQLSFDEQFLSYVEEFISGIVASTGLSNSDKIILLDDGAELLLYANDFFKNYEKIIGIEQTSSGFQRLKDTKLNFPVINIARTQAKLSLESPMIAEVTVAKMLQRMREKESKGLKVLVVGQGPIGKAIVKLLPAAYDVDTYDLESHGNHFPGSYTNKLDEFDVIMGATGQPILQPGDFSRLKKDVILVSCSSSDREFSAAYLRRLAKASSNCHQDVVVDGLMLLNSGFPINFDGGLHSVAPEKIQLTRSLLLAGIFTAVQGGAEKGLVSLNSNFEDRIIDRYQRLNKS